jgi:CDP-glucose 4,6-dehydratase
MRAWSKNEIVEIRSPNATRPWQHVLEPLSGYLILAKELSSNPGLNGESFNFGPNAEYNHSVKDIIEDLSAYWNFKNMKSVYDITDDIKFHEAGLLKLNCDKALFYLKWIASLKYEQLIKFTGEWYFKYYQHEDDIYQLTLNQISEYEKYAIEKGVKWAVNK